MRLFWCVVIAALMLFRPAFAQAPGGAQMPPTSAEQGWANCTIQLGRMNDGEMATQMRIKAMEHQLADAQSRLEWTLKNWVPGPGGKTVPPPPGPPAAKQEK